MYFDFILVKICNGSKVSSKARFFLAEQSLQLSIRVKKKLIRRHNRQHLRKANQYNAHRSKGGN